MRRYPSWPAVALMVRTLLPLPLVLGMGGPRSAPLTAIVPERITVVSTPVSLDPADPMRTRVGSLTLLGGWALNSKSSQFGGWSGLHLDGSRVTALGDFGSILRFRLTTFGRAVDARVDPLTAGCGDYRDRNDRDSESLVRTRPPLRPGWLVGFESHSRICHISADFRVGKSYSHPRLSRWRSTGGPEAMVALRDGRVLVFSEYVPAGKKLRTLLIFSGDPTIPGTPVVERSYLPPAGYNPTDAAELPDGRILVVHRKFSVFSRFTTILTAINPEALERSEGVAGAPVAQFAPPLVSDNFEGLAVTEEQGRHIIWMMSDDNFMSWQKTYLLKFAIDPLPVARPRKP